MSINAALRASEPSKLDGMVLVPREPTLEMLDSVELWRDETRKFWAAMIAAAPTREESRQPVEPVAVNHEEALQLAYMRRDTSNLARCYIALTAAKAAQPESVEGGWALVAKVRDKFAADEAQGYRSSDRTYAIDLLTLALPRPAESAAPGAVDDAMVIRAARALSDRSADSCDVNREDNWNTYVASYVADARAALTAALAHKSDAIDWRGMYRFQTAMRFMDNMSNLSKAGAYKMADDDVASLERIQQHKPDAGGEGK
jgi:hypothetical protein